MFYPEKYEQRKEEYSSLVRFLRLLGENRFVYHFQPIVSAHTGEIVAYEALMRSDPSIGYGPLEILSLAEKRGRLYDIELATLRNALTALSENQSSAGSPPKNIRISSSRAERSQYTASRT